MPSRAAGVADLTAGIIAHSRSHLARGITLVESRRPDDRTYARELVSRLRNASKITCGVGISGIPGVGKSSFIEKFGSQLIARGEPGQVDNRLGIARPS